MTVPRTLAEDDGDRNPGAFSDIAFQLADITDRFPPDVTYKVERISSGTQYGGETILLLERRTSVEEDTR